MRFWLGITLDEGLDSSASARIGAVTSNFQTDGSESGYAGLSHSTK
jgi:hypothetical protein